MSDNNVTSTYTYFRIRSSGVHNDDEFIPSSKGIFEPHEITKLLGIEPYSFKKPGDYVALGRYCKLSCWSGCKSTIDGYNVAKQSKETVHQLISKIDELKKIKNEYDIDYCLVVVQHIYETSPIMSFEDEVIKFCADIGATIEIDTY